MVTVNHYPVALLFPRFFARLVLFSLLPSRLGHPINISEWRPFLQWGKKVKTLWSRKNAKKKKKKSEATGLWCTVAVIKQKLLCTVGV